MSNENTNNKKYFFVCVHISGDDGDRIDALRKDIEHRFDVHAARKIPPHITLVPPFHADDLLAFMDDVEAAAKSFKGSHANVPGFSSFSSNKVWFMDVEKSQALLDIKARMEGLCSQHGLREPSEYEPHFHITLAYKDVKSGAFKSIGDYLKDVDVPVAEVAIDNITIMVKTDGRWEVFRRFPLK